MLRHRGKILKHIGRKVHKHSSKGGSINHLVHHHHLGGNISELKKKLAHMVIGKPKKAHRIKF